MIRLIYNMIHACWWSALLVAGALFCGIIFCAIVIGVD